MANDDDDLDFGVEDNAQFQKLQLNDDTSNELQALKAQVAKDPNNAALHAQLAKALAENEETDDALKELDKAIQLQPASPVYYTQKAHIFLDLHDTEDALKLLSKALEVAQNDAEVYFEMGRAYEMAGDRAKARQNFKKALEKNENHVEAMIQVAAGYLNDTDAKNKDSNQEEALKLYRKIIAVSPKKTNAYYNAVQILQSRNKEADLKEATALLSKGVAAAPSDGQMRAKLIQVYDALNLQKEREQARIDIHKAFQTGALNKSFAQVGRFCCTQYETGDYFIMGYDHFKLQDPKAVKYAFMIYKKGELNEEKVLFRISLTSFEEDNKKAIQAGEIAQGQRIYRLEAFHPKERRTYVTYKEEPTYQTVKEQVQKILSGELKPTATAPL